MSIVLYSLANFFFFQAEDGIRDYKVTGVQTCALPICVPIAAESSLTQPGAAIGTPGYMAPEQAASGRVDGRADLHSLAVVAFEALGGGPPAFKADRAGLVRALRTARPALSARVATALVAPLAERPEDRPATAAAWLAALGRAEVRPWRPWAAAGIIAVVGAGALRLLLGSHAACRLPHDAPARLAVMPFAVLGTPPYPASQLPEYFISRFRPVERLSEVVAFGRVAAQIASEHPSNEEAQALACRLGAKFFVQGSVAYVGPTVSLQATLYEGGRARRSAKAEGRVGAEESEVMDRVWAGLYPEFTPGADATLPNGGPEALAAYLNAEAAFRRGDYRTARDEYTRVIRADSGFASRAGGPDGTGFRHGAARGAGAPGRTFPGRQPAARRVHPAARRRRRPGGARSIQARHRAGTELPPGVVRARRVLLSLRRPVRRDGRRGRGRVQPRPRSRSAVRAGHRTLDLAGAPGRRPARDGGPDSPLLAYRLNVSRGRSSGHRRHTHPRLRSGPARAAPHRVPAQLPGAGVPRLPGGRIWNPGAAHWARARRAALPRATRRHGRGAGPDPPHGHRCRSGGGVGRQRPPATRAGDRRLGRTGAGPVGPARPRDRAASVGRLAGRRRARSDAPRHRRRHRRRRPLAARAPRGGALPPRRRAGPARRWEARPTPGQPRRGPRRSRCPGTP